MLADKRVTSGEIPGCSAGCSDPDLARVIEAWATLPEPIRSEVLALVGVAAR